MFLLLHLSSWIILVKMHCLCLDSKDHTNMFWAAPVFPAMDLLFVGGIGLESVWVCCCFLVVPAHRSPAQGCLQHCRAAAAEELLQDVLPRNESSLWSSWNELDLQEEAEKTQLRKLRKWKQDCFLKYSRWYIWWEELTVPGKENLIGTPVGFWEAKWHGS